MTTDACPSTVAPNLQYATEVMPRHLWIILLDFHYQCQQCLNPDESGHILVRIQKKQMGLSRITSELIDALVRIIDLGVRHDYLFNNASRCELFSSCAFDRVQEVLELPQG